MKLYLCALRESSVPRNAGFPGVANGVRSMDPGKVDDALLGPAYAYFTTLNELHL
jgi:hypothetical protein